MQSKEFLLQSEMPFQLPDPGIKRQIMGYNKEIMMARVLFEKGAIGTQHQHPHIQTSYVVSGQFEVTIGGKTQVLNPGEGFFVPADVLHGAVCLEAGELIDVFAPMRETFIQ